MDSVEKSGTRKAGESLGWRRALPTMNYLFVGFARCVASSYRGSLGLGPVGQTKCGRYRGGCAEEGQVVGLGRGLVGMDINR